MKNIVNYSFLNCNYVLWENIKIFHLVDPLETTPTSEYGRNFCSSVYTGDGKHAIFVTIWVKDVQAIYSIIQGRKGSEMHSPLLDVCELIKYDRYGILNDMAFYSNFNSNQSWVNFIEILKTRGASALRLSTNKISHHNYH